MAWTERFFGSSGGTTLGSLDNGTVASLKDQFSGFYPLTEDDLADIVKHGLIVLDTNVLLNLYKYQAAGRDAILGVLESIKDRLWLPHQVALEFQRRREDIIAGQMKTFDKVREILNYGRIKSALDALNLRKFHSLISVEKVLASLKLTLDTFDDELRELEKQQPRITDPDVLRDRLGKLFGQNVGAPFDDATLQELYQHGSERYRLRVPPGYGDEKEKKDQPDFIYGGCTYRPMYGDLILWEQLLRHAEQPEITAVVFLSDDSKPDWRHVISQKGHRRVLPRPELVEELRRRAGVERFTIYTSDEFLKAAQRWLGSGVSAESIQQVADIQDEAFSQAELRERAPDVSFKKYHEWDAERQAIKFWAVTNQGTIPCAVSSEALEDWFGADGTSSRSMDAFFANMDTIRAKAIDLIRLGRFTSSGEILLRSADFTLAAAPERVIMQAEMTCDVPPCRCDVSIPAYILRNGRLSPAIAGACRACGHDVLLHHMTPLPRPG